MKTLILAVGVLTAFCFSAGAAEKPDKEHCGINIAKRFADGVIARSRLRARICYFGLSPREMAAGDTLLRSVTYATLSNCLLWQIS